jgi:hypothetical protein
VLVKENQQGYQIQGRSLSPVLELVPDGFVRREIACFGPIPVRLEIPSERLPGRLDVLRSNMDHERETPH